MSLAEALLPQVQRRVPDGATLNCVTVQAGPALAVEPMAMQMAWQALTAHTEMAGSQLAIEILPWELHCHDCGRVWSSDDPLDLCACGSAATQPLGDSRLRLMALDIEPGDAVSGSIAAALPTVSPIASPEDEP